MRLVVIAVGRLKQGPERELAERYAKRFDEVGRKLGFRGLEIHEIAESRARDALREWPRRPPRFRPRSPKNPSWWRSTSAATISTAPHLPGVSAGGGTRRRQHYFRDRRRGRTFARFAAQGEAQGRVRLRDLAASNGSRHASGAALPGRDHFGGPPLSPRVRRARRATKARFGCRCEQARHHSSSPTPSAAAGCCCRRSPPSDRRPCLSRPLPRRTRLRARHRCAGRGSPRARRHQAARAGTGSRPRAAEERGRAQAKLKADIAAIGQDRSKLNQQLIDIAAQVRGVETRIGDAEGAAASARRPRAADPRLARFAPLRDRRGAGGAAARRPAHAAGPAGAARRRAAIAAHRDAARRRRAGVARARRKTRRRSRRAGHRCARPSPAERDRLAADRDKLRDDQTRLAALVDERQRKQVRIEKDMEAEGARAIALSKQVDNLQGLIAKMEQDLKSAAKAAATASLQGAPATATASRIRRC